MSQISNNKLRDQTDACNFAVCNKDAIEAGRDGASAFKSVINTKGFAYAAERARKIIVSQCPEGYITIACQSFDQNVEPIFKARTYLTKSGCEQVEIEKESNSLSLETTMQLHDLSPN